MSRVQRQPIWWIVVATVLLFLCLADVLGSLSGPTTARQSADLMLTSCVAVGTTSYAFGYRMGEQYFWGAVAILYLAADGPYLVGILFRLARATFNPTYALRQSPSYYVFMILMMTFWMTATLRLAQSFSAKERDGTSRLKSVFGD